MDVLRRLLDRHGPPVEFVGDPHCPVTYRWTLFPWGEKKHENKDARFKLLIHFFVPNHVDTDVHDHPRSFVTLVLGGWYLDIADEGAKTELMMRGRVRFRRADHAHRTVAGPNGAWTLLLMGPITREWGFWHKGRWFYWRDWITNRPASAGKWRCP